MYSIYYLVKKMSETKFNKKFWEKWIETNGTTFDPEQGQLIYLYSESYDLEEEKVEFEIFTDEILSLKVWLKDEDGSESTEFAYIPMENISEIRHLIQH